MPYQGEFASYKPLSRLLSNPKVQDVIARCQRRDTSGDPAAALPTVATTRPSGFLPNLVLAVDGSAHQLPVDNGFPAAELACLTATAVLINLARQRELDQQRPVDPQDFQATQDATSIDCALPGCNVLLDEDSPEASFRRQFYEATGEARLFEGGESLLDTYHHLLGLRAGNGDQKCPNGDACGETKHGDPRRLIVGPLETVCPCKDAIRLYGTDALRMHEGFNPTGSSGAMFYEAMQVLERLWLINFLRGLEKQSLLTAHHAIAMVLDGPLAVHGHPAWLSQAILTELRRLNSVAAESGHDLLVLGIEKSGLFVDHFAAIDQTDHKDGTRGVAPQTALLLPNDYIHRNILLSEGKTYGQDTYFGRKFFYKTRVGSRIVASLPFYTKEQRDLSRAEPEQYPRLADAMALLDALFSTRFPNAITPLVIAHSEAAIPLNIGRRALEQLVAHLRR